MMMNKGKKLKKIFLATILASSIAAGNSAFAATTYDYLDGQWLPKEAVPTYKYTSNDNDITDWAVPVFDKQGKQVFELVYIPEGEKLLRLYSYTSQYEMLKDSETGEKVSPLLNQAFVIGTKYWADVIKTNNTKPLQLFIVSANEYANANAYPWNLVGVGGDYKHVSENILADVIQQSREIVHLSNLSDLYAKELQTGEYTAFGQITVGDYIGSKEWDSNKGLYGMRIDVENLSHLPSSEGSADLIPILNHELTHALGMILPAQRAMDSHRNYITDVAVEYEGDDWYKRKYNYIFKFNEQLNGWASHLMDQNGNMAKASQYIAPTVKAESMIKEADGKLSMDDFFVVDNMYIYGKGVDEGGIKQPHADTPYAGKAFFVGDNVSELLNGAEKFKTPISGVYGIGVNTWEPYDNKYFYPELSHTSLPILMSHNQYRNYATNTELELAVMKDIGYDIDIRNQYGYSVYGSNLSLINEAGYSARNAEGTAYLTNTYNNAYYGVGLHVFGSNNTITQQGDILTNGLGAIGVRIDGEGNTTTIAKECQVHADGVNGIGVLQSYGNSHELNVKGEVTATHKTGNAVQFDFGANMLGSAGEYRGSYIRYSRLANESDGLLTEGRNISFDSIPFVLDGNTPELDGALVNNFNLSGSISGGKNAIYIGKNAFVENINVLEGASITGNISSDWKDFAPKEDAQHTNYYFNTGAAETGYVAPTRIENGQEVANESIMLQYKGEKYAYDTYIPDLVTNLNINADFIYNGNITGKENMRINVNSGTFAFAGTADVTKVIVAPEAILQGENFKLNNMSSKLATGFSDDNTGKLINKGMISAALPNGNATFLNIEGTVVNDGGSLAFIGNAGNQGFIKINGSIEGDTVLAINPNGIYLPGDSYDISDFVTVNGEKLSFTETKEYNNGVLKAVYNDDFTQLDFVTAETLEETQAAEEMGNLTRTLAKQGATEKELLVGELFKMEPAKANKTLKAIKGRQSANIPAVMQQNNLVHNTLGMRLSQVNRAKTVNVNVPVKHLTEGEADAEPMDIIVQPEYDMWAKVSRNKGSINAESDFKTDAYSIGWDKQVSPDWRFGFFGSYAKGKFEAETIQNDLQDYRLGVYGGYNKGAAEALVYSDYGWGKNKLNRTLSGLELSTKARYDSDIMEIGAEYKYDLQYDNNRAWHVAPYGKLQLNRYNQKAYAESGAEPFNKKVDSQNNTYAGVETGVGLERRFANSSTYGMRLGYKRNLTGVEPKQNYHYTADPTHRYTNYGEGDKNKLVFSLNGEVVTVPNWSLSCEVNYERGKKGHDYSGELSLKHTW